ncbi:unnamed protein product [Didymodactylos carnosus]|uniref:Peptidase C51 domain-containing protein n=1 Tax=Didymodactylos carnosus TaxID=1234261 RepID=A0A814P873_9BILA|nr:unnamed protein product [Didymodactylos carnosus]CAF1132065.1 unnamed protein product [Didymodactylos carnosus]CAF3865194.1 unnamed protein product [Didymodactylos carnosus]CAF3916462.1 unnamed protein product [Didymodactylos carnosus]
MHRGRRELVPYNHIQGFASTNVPAYSNGDDNFFSNERHYVHGIFTGFKWQCVEFARRWLLMRKSCIFRNIRSAADIWSDLISIERVTDGQHFPLKAFRNGSPHKPKSDSLLIYPRHSSELPFGHVAIICEVGSEFVCIAEQNYRFHHWSNKNYARQLRLTFKNDLYYIEDYYEISGWMEIGGSNHLEPFDESKVNSILEQYKQ